jgi:methyl-accepting chemotaxis protein
VSAEAKEGKIVMGWVGNSKIATKLMIGFGAVVAITAVVGWIGIRNMAALNAQTESLYEAQLVSIVDLAAMRGMTHRVRAGILLSLSEKDPNEARAHVERVRELTRRLAEAREKLWPLIRGQEVRDAFKRYEDAAAEYATYREDKIFRPLLAGQREAALAGAREAGQKFQVTMQALNDTIKVEEGLARKKFEESQALYASSRLSMIGLVIGGSAAGLAFGLLVSRVISRPLAQTVAFLRELAEGEGDLTRRLRAAGMDEVGEVAAGFNLFMDKLHDIMVQVRGAAGQAGGASRELSVAAEQLAAGAQEQASSLEETAASLEEITGTVRQNADNAKQANQLAVGAREVAEKGGQVVAAAVGSMREINRASKKIADIITTIDEIAFQTNLLALNAAVEAARAGEQGRGFAVVAAEVRNLAQRSALAAKEIRGLIQDSVQKVEAGSELVNRSGETLKEIEGSVKRVTDIIAEIAAASQEQTAGVDQVSRAVTQMDQVTQANAAQTEGLSSTAQALAAQAEQMAALVGRFKLAVAAGATRPHATPMGRPLSDDAAAATGDGCRAAALEQITFGSTLADRRAGV